MRSGTFQSFGFEPANTTLITTSSGPGLGIGESTIWTKGPAAVSVSVPSRL